MGLFEKIFGSKQNQRQNVNTPQSTPTTKTNNIGGLYLSKEESLNSLNLSKNVISSLCLEKKELSNLTSRVAVVMDYSGSMEHSYKIGKVQRILERILPLALKFDDNGELETWIFSTKFHRLENITLDNYFGYIDNENILRKYSMGGTSFSPVMSDVIQKYTVEEPANIPTYVIFITDGENSDRESTTDLIIKNCTKPIFWQFVGIDSRSFKYLEGLDEMEGREIDNVNFFKLDDILSISDEDLYRKLLNEYPSWLKEAKAKNII